MELTFLLYLAQYGYCWAVSESSWQKYSSSSEEVCRCSEIDWSVDVYWKESNWWQKNEETVLHDLWDDFLFFPFAIEGKKIKKEKMNEWTNERR